MTMQITVWSQCDVGPLKSIIELWRQKINSNNLLIVYTYVLRKNERTWERDILC